MRLQKTIQIILLLTLSLGAQAAERQKLNFNADWRLCVGDFPEASKEEFDDSQWQRVTLPYAFNGDEAFKKDIVDLTDTICWYRKEFKVQSSKFKVSKFFIEFGCATGGRLLPQRTSCGL